uniref:Uncharacterized protein n=1 Tax=Zea mays TaxID=4577 RepID=C0PMF0_MAIZE|nr:unknown [Zea mays]
MPRLKTLATVLHSSSSGRSSSSAFRCDAGTGGTPRNSRGVSPSSFKPLWLLARSVGTWVKTARAEALDGANVYAGTPSLAATPIASTQNMSMTSECRCCREVTEQRNLSSSSLYRRSVFSMESNGCLPEPATSAGGGETGGRTWKEMDGLAAATRLNWLENSGTTTMVTSKPWLMKTLASSAIGTTWPVPALG